MPVTVIRNAGEVQRRISEWNVQTTQMKTLAISWNTSLVRFVLSESTKGHAIRVLKSGERPLRDSPLPQEEQDEGSEESDDEEASGSSAAATPVASRVEEPRFDMASSLVATIRSIVKDTKAAKARLVICLNRGLVESTVF
ncbi:MAG: hypothetical protein KDA96_22365, partial [Planctomycetaceae bacterium]|nr:hypothetical protein [Planctomycetaceae bacterium]